MLPPSPSTPLLLLLLLLAVTIPTGSTSTFTYPIIADHPAGGLPTASSIQLVNAGASGIMEVKADGCKMHMLAMDGVYRRTEIEAQNELILLPATRAEIALECRSAGSYVLRTERNEANDVFLGSDPEERMDQDLISLSITAAGGEHWEILDELPELPPQLRVDLGDSDVKVEGKQHTITMGGIGIKRPRTDRRREILLDNTISNFEHKIMDKIKKPNICHPFHIHINHFQVQDVERNEGWFVDKEEEEEEKELGDSVFLDCVKLVPSNIDVSYSGYDVETTSKVVAHLRSLQN
ncbi:hypothetical protein TrLO_g13799 [Triparma laevis f. longispina]|uniref:Uncharacterized protein n=1 Tax=Triparma laevis f. longispina TaxID=1714387 RepID=A0A9W7FEE5_9STRA|nr:hypothetical protein TrLO_g13799 [Triparma laevis f. longispina]